MSTTLLTNINYKKIVIVLIAVCAFPAAYVGYLTYEARNISPFQRETDQYEGWMFAHYNEGVIGAENCKDADGSWAKEGVSTSPEFTAGCQAWFEKP